MSTPTEVARARLGKIAYAIQGVFDGAEATVDDRGTVLRGEAALARLLEQREAERDQVLVRLWEVVESIDQQLADLGHAVEREATGTLAERLDDVSDRELIAELARRAEVNAVGPD